MPTFAQWEAARRGQAPTATSDAPVDGGTTPSPLGDMHRATNGDDYASAFEGELLRTGKEAAIGMARGIPDTVTGLYNTVRHPLDTLMGLGHVVAHPVDSAMELAKHPRDAGSLLTQMLLAPKLPGAANAVLREGPSIAGRATSAVGRGMEAVGTSRVAKAAAKYGPMEAALRMDPYGIAVAAAPQALEYGGKGLQKLGGSLEGLDLSLKRNPLRGMFSEAGDPEAETVRETVNTARDLKDNHGMSAAQAGQRAGWPLGKSAEGAAYPNEPVSADLYPYQKENLASGRQDVLERNYLDENPWALDASAKPAGPQDLKPALQGLQDAVRRSELSPIEKFYEDDPQARVGGEGRMTGQFEEGEGGLRDISAGNFTRNEVPSPTDSRVSSLDMPLDAPESAAFFDEGLRPLAETGRPTTGPPLSPLDELSRMAGRSVFDRTRLSNPDILDRQSALKEWVGGSEYNARVKELLDKLGGRGVGR